MQFREFDISPVVFEQARALGMYGNVQDRLKDMARRSAPFTHPEGNRRFEGYILMIREGVILAIAKFTGAYHGDRRAKRTDAPATSHAGSKLVICPDCEGDGGVCLTCNSTGRVTETHLHSIAS
jgi:hypothetical protein